MSEWITDRPPTKEDARPAAGLVWTTYNGKTFPWSYDGVEEGAPWMRMIVPEPYVKRKRYTVKWLAHTQCWAVMDSHYAVLRAVQITSREAAERIAAVYEEVMP